MKEKSSREIWIQLEGFYKKKIDEVDQLKQQLVIDEAEILDRDLEIEHLKHQNYEDETTIRRLDRTIEAMDQFEQQDVDLNEDVDIGVLA